MEKHPRVERGQGSVIGFVIYAEEDDWGGFKSFS